MKLSIPTNNQIIKIQIKRWQKQVVFNFYGIRAGIERKIEMNLLRVCRIILKSGGQKTFSSSFELLMNLSTKY